MTAQRGQCRACELSRGKGLSGYAGARLCGAEIHDIQLDGDDLVVNCSPASAVFLQGKGSRATQVLGQGLTNVRLPAHKLGKTSFLRVTVVDAQGRRAWSNPFWRDEA